MPLIDPTLLTLLLRLLLAHIVVDFILQPKSWVDAKNEKGVRSWQLYIHVVLVFVFTWLFSANWAFILPAFLIATSHGVIDVAKIYLNAKYPNQKTLLFVSDQIAHILIIIFVWSFYSKTNFILDALNVNILSKNNALAVTIAYAFCIWPARYVISKVTDNLIDEQDRSGGDHISGGGALIGIFERVIILTFVLFNQYDAIGFLITGKSILRFADGQKKQTEYVLVGTMLSYLLAIASGILVKLMFLN